ncbi:unnamed protein product, partial [Pelagomonas calceolata]
VIYWFLTGGTGREASDDGRAGLSRHGGVARQSQLHLSRRRAPAARLLAAALVRAAHEVLLEHVLHVDALLVRGARRAPVVGAVGVAALDREALLLELLARPHRQDRREVDESADRLAAHGVAQALGQGRRAAVAHQSPIIRGAAGTRAAAAGLAALGVLRRSQRVHLEVLGRLRPQARGAPGGVAAQRKVGAAVTVVVAAELDGPRRAGDDGRRDGGGRGLGGDDLALDGHGGPGGRLVGALLGRHGYVPV